MRIHGTLTKWNDDRGFGFITPAKGPPDLFVHVSAFPRESGRPQLNELISFEVEAAPDGRQRAVRVMRPAQKLARSAPAREYRPRTPYRTRKRAGSIALLAISAVGVFAWSHFQQKEVPFSAALERSVEPAAPAQNFSCDGRTMCPQMRSCEEATYFLRSCPGTKMDGDGDGVPCEDQWCD